jgi:hypothetical protein
LVNWIIVLGVAVIIVVIGSVGKIPFTDKQLATTEETRVQFEIDNTPTYTRQQAISIVEDFLKTDCESGAKYLLNVDVFEASWIREPWTNDHNQRAGREWSVNDPMTGGFWRMYEDTLEIVTIRGNC